MRGEILGYDSDDNGAYDVEDLVDGNDAKTNEDKEVEGEEYVTADSDSQDDFLLQFYFFIWFCFVVSD